MTEPLSRAKLLAEKMARVLDNEDVSDVTIAVALLTSGVVYQYRFIQNRPRTSLVALKSDAAAETSEDQLSRDFLGLFDFRLLQQICQYRKSPAKRPPTRGGLSIRQGAIKIRLR